MSPPEGISVVRTRTQRQPRLTVANVIDVCAQIFWALFVVGITTPPYRTGAAPVALIVFPVAYLGVSFVHRVVLQWAFQATLGKAITGLRVVDTATGDRASFKQLVRRWLRR